MALRQTHRRMDDFLDSLNNGERPEIEAMVEQGLADVADGRVVPGDVAMQRARDLIERKVRAAG